MRKNIGLKLITMFNVDRLIPDKFMKTAAMKILSKSWFLQPNIPTEKNHDYIDEKSPNLKS